MFRTLFQYDCCLRNLLQSLIHSGSGERTPESPEPQCLREPRYPQKEHHHHSQAQSPPPAASLSSRGRLSSTCRSSLSTAYSMPRTTRRGEGAASAMISRPLWGASGRQQDARKALGTVRWSSVKKHKRFHQQEYDTKEDVFVYPTAMKKNNPRKYLRSVRNGDYGV